MQARPEVYTAVTDPGNPKRSDKRRRFSTTELTLFGMIFMLSIGEGGARFLSPVYLADRGTAVGSIGLSLSIFGASALAARLLVGSTFQATAVRLTVLISGLASTASLLLITTTSSIAVFTVLIGIHGVGWGVMATVLLALVIGGKDKRAAAAVIGFYVGVEGLGRTGSPILSGILGGAFGPSTGMRIHTALFAATVAIGLLFLRNAPALQPAAVSAEPKQRFEISRFRRVPLAAWVAALTGFYLNTTNALLNTFFPLLGLSLGFSLAQIGTLAGSRSAVSALVRFGAHRAFDRIPFNIQFVPLYLINAFSASLIGVITFYPAQFFLFIPNGASRGVLRVGSMAQAMEDSEEPSAGATAALIGAGYDVGRIIGPAVGGLVAAAVGLSTMFTVLPLVFVGVILPMALWTRRR